jgi:hypothetical protein
MAWRGRRASWALTLLLLSNSCSKATDIEASETATQAAVIDDSGPSHPNLRPGESSHIPVGSFLAGSRPGDPGRRPEIEPRQTSVQLGPFRIDRLPYPNDPNEPARLGMSRDAAVRACAERDGRLCTELEWERACKGPESSTYATGPEWNAACETDPKTCPNGFDLFAMGSLLEWTSSDVVPPRGETKPAGAVVRGATADVPGAQRRCARRVTRDEIDTAQVGFRCCYGAPNGVKLAEPVLGAPYAKVALEARQIAKLLELDERTRFLSQEVSVFREPEAAGTVVDRGPGDRKGFLFTVNALEWKPERGAHFLVISGRSGKSTSFVVVYHVVNPEEHRLAASFVMKDEPGPVALAYSDSIRPRLHFSTCWGCPGETGKILFRPPETVAIFQP